MRLFTATCSHPEGLLSQALSAHPLWDGTDLRYKEPGEMNQYLQPAFDRRSLTGD